MTESDKAVMQQTLGALPDMTELSSSMDERAVYGYTADQMQAYAFAAIAQPATQKNFCSRCGKRLGGVDDIHTCTPPVDPKETK